MCVCMCVCVCVCVCVIKREKERERELKMDILPERWTSPQFLLNFLMVFGLFEFFFNRVLEYLMLYVGLEINWSLF